MTDLYAYMITDHYLGKITGSPVCHVTPVATGLSTLKKQALLSLSIDWYGYIIMDIYQ